MIMDKIYYKLYWSDSANGVYQLDYTNLDTKTLKKILNDYDMLCGKYNVYDGDFMSIFLYDVGVAISACEFTDIQARRLSKWFEGYTESSIAEDEGVSRWVVSKSLHAACAKILDGLKDGDEDGSGSD